MDTEHAWAAGFWDGEGNICFHGEYSLVMQVSQKHNPVCINRFYEAVERRGRLSQRERKQSTVPGIVYVWACTRRQHILHVMGLLYPYLSQPKIDQFEEHALARGWNIT